MDFLRASGTLDNTVVIVTSDHGEEFMDHGQVQHNALYEELVRIPMIIRHPGKPEGSRSDAPVINIDLLPTIASITGADVPPNLDGIDLRGPYQSDRHRIVTGMTNKQRFEILSEAGGRKLIQTCSPEYSEELYDLNLDPGESQNIILDQPELANHLGQLLQAAIKSEPCALIEGVSRGRAPEDLLSAEQIEELKSLGYIQ
jgi:arylsulfatase A-like enzyme